VRFLTAAVIGELERAIGAARGREIAGILLEDAAGEQRVQLAPNLAHEPGAVDVPRFWLDRALRRRDPAGFHAVAFLHSHLSSLDLSETDRGSMRDSSLPWIVLLMRDDRLAWVVHERA
jgi:proteasome lid subunit RPN8/RPN11